MGDHRPARPLCARPGHPAADLQFHLDREPRDSLGIGQAETDLHRWLLVSGTGAIAAGVAYWIGREKSGGDRLALGLVLGGALGNIVDRVRLGYVVDFLDLHFGGWRPFYVFNVADAAISIGVVILLLRAFFARKAAPQETHDHA